MGDDETLWGLYCLMIMYIFASVVVYARALWSSVSVLVRARRWLSEVCRRPSSTPSAVQEKLQRDAKVILERRRIERARSTLSSMSGCCFLGVLFMFTVGPSDFPMSAYCFIGAAIAIFISERMAIMLTTQGVRLLYAVLMMLLIVSCSPYVMWGVETHEESGIILRFLSRLCCTMWVQDLRMGLLWNVLFTTAFSFFIWFGPDGMDETGAISRSVQECIFREIGMCCTLLLLAKDRARSFQSEAFRLAQVQALSTEGSAKTSLLKAMCDVVVVLDEERKIAQPCPQLGHMLRARQSLKGDTLHNYIATEEDRARFDQFMAVAPDPLEGDSEDLAQILNVHLRDWSGAERRVELLRARFVNVDGSTGHLVGIRGVPEERSLSLDPEGLLDMDMSFGPNSPYSPDDGLVISFDALQWKVYDHSLPFAVLCGETLVGSSMKELLPDAFAFYAWVQQCAMKAFYGQASPSCPVDHLSLHVKRSSRQVRLRIDSLRLFSLPAMCLAGSGSVRGTIVMTIRFVPLQASILHRLADAQRDGIWLPTNGGTYRKSSPAGEEVFDMSEDLQDIGEADDDAENDNASSICTSATTVMPDVICTIQGGLIQSI